MKINRYYICDSCDHHFEISQERDESLKKKCPACKRNTLYQDLTGQYAMIYQEPKTVGHLAERNTERAGKYELESARAKHKRVKKEGAKPWYNPDGKNLPTALSHIDSVEKKQKYIMNGEI